MAKSNLRKHVKRVMAHVLHSVPITAALSVYGIISFPLSLTTNWVVILAPIAFAATIVEILGRKYDLFS